MRPCVCACIDPADPSRIDRITRSSPSLLRTPPDRPRCGERVVRWSVSAGVPRSLHPSADCADCASTRRPNPHGRLRCADRRSAGHLPRRASASAITPVGDSGGTADRHAATADGNAAAEADAYLCLGIAGGIGIACGRTSASGTRVGGSACVCAPAVRPSRAFGCKRVRLHSCVNPTQICPHARIDRRAHVYAPAHTCAPTQARAHTGIDPSVCHSYTPAAANVSLPKLPPPTASSPIGHPAAAATSCSTVWHVCAPDRACVGCSSERCRHSGRRR
jgi:hypothetical protein